MSEQKPPKSVNRRNFLKGVGIATDIVALSPLPFVSPVSARFDAPIESRPVKIGPGLSQRRLGQSGRTTTTTIT